MVLVEDANAFLTQISGIVLSIVALVGVALKFALSHSHNPRLVALETKAQVYDQQIGDLVNQVNAHKDQIMKGVAVADVLVPQLGKAATDNAAQIADLQKQLADAQAKIDLLTTVVPLANKSAVTAPTGVV